MNEAALQRQIQQFVRLQGGVILKAHSTGIQRQEIDLLGGLYGVPFAVEVKLPGGTVSLFQRIRLEQYAAQGYRTGIVRSLDEFKELINEPGANT